MQKKLATRAIFNGAFGVDTFFFISGFLVTYIFMKSKAKMEKLSKDGNTGFMQFLTLFLYRFVRLTGPYLFILGVNEVTIRYFASNSIFEPFAIDNSLDHVSSIFLSNETTILISHFSQINCPKYWWRNALYIQTFFPVKDMCMIWGWYVANDTQLFVLATAILIISVKHYRFAVAMFFTFFVSSWLTTGEQLMLIAINLVLTNPSFKE
jgi:peptidoglycan/LPS O-acetylase OafA/YrhL